MAVNQTRYKPYTIRGEPTATMMEQVDEMFGLLFQDLEINETSDLLNATISDVEAGSPSAGAIIVGNTDTPSNWEVLDTDILFIDIPNVRLGIGTSAPSTTLHVKRGDAGTEPTWTASDVAILENTSGSNSVLNFFTSNAAIGGIGFSDTDARSVGTINYSHATDAMSFGTNSSTRLTITSAGLFNFATDSGVGIIDTGADHYMRLDYGENATADRTLSFVLGNTNRTVTVSGATTISQDYSTAGSPQFTGLTITGTGSITGALQFDSDALRLADTNASHYLILTPGSDLSANRVLTLTTGDSARTVTISGNTTISQDYSTAGTPQFTGVITGSLQADTITNDTGLAAGVYTPTRSAEANLDANVTMTEAQYLRVGNTVTVSGAFTADPTTPATATSFEFTLPVASNIGAVEDAAGVAFCGAIAGQGAAISGSVANNTAVVSWVSGDVTSQTWSYIFAYQVI